MRSFFCIFYNFSPLLWSHIQSISLRLPLNTSSLPTWYTYFFHFFSLWRKMKIKRGSIVDSYFSSFQKKKTSLSSIQFTREYFLMYSEKMFPSEWELDLLIVGFHTKKKHFAKDQSDIGILRENFQEYFGEGNSWKLGRTWRLFVVTLCFLRGNG